MRNSPIIAQQQAETQAIASVSEWSSKVRMGYYSKGTQIDAEGLNAGISVEIPLFSKQRQIETAKARLRLAESKQALIKEFLVAVSHLSGMAAKHAEAVELRAFYRDRLEYFKQATDEGLHEADALWSDAEKARKSEHTARQAALDFNLKLETTARQFGEQEWMTLKNLLAEYVKQNRPSKP
jgi:hypothetical protein